MSGKKEIILMRILGCYNVGLTIFLAIRGDAWGAALGATAATLCLIAASEEMRK